MSDRLIPLEELQDIGERYSPRVLREYFHYNWFSGSPAYHIGEHTYPEFSYEELPARKLRFVKSMMMFNIPTYWITIIFGSLLFASDRCKLGTPSIVVFGYGILASVVAECAAVLSLTRNFSTLSKFHLFSSILGKFTAILQTCSIITIFSNSSPLTLISSPIVLIGIILVVIQIKEVSGLIARRIIWGEIPTPVDLVASRTRISQTNPIPETVRSAVASPSTFPQLHKIIRTASVCGWEGLYHVLLSSHCAVPDQSELILISSIKSYLTCLGFSLLLLPVKVFYIYDYEMSSIVVASIVLSVLHSFTTCLLNVIPQNPKSVIDIIEQDV